MTPSRRALSFPVFMLLTGFTVHAQEPATMAFGPMNVEFMSSPIAFDSQPVTGAPYSAEAVTEIVQALADGNRIVRESRTQVSRDGKGRTRREEGLAMFGPLVGGPNTNGGMRHVQISDPEARTTVMLDLQNRIAHRVPAPQFTFANRIAGGVNVRQFEMAVPPPPPPPPPPLPPGAPEAGVRIFRSREVLVGDEAGLKPVVENLGKQFMEGVEAEGTRSTVTIPAGRIGNELPIKIVSERWFSPELQVLVMSRQSDPRYGDTTYRLTNLTRGEPSPELFEIPPDFTVMEAAKERNVIIERNGVK